MRVIARAVRIIYHFDSHQEVLSTNYYRQSMEPVYILGIFITLR